MMEEMKLEAVELCVTACEKFAGNYEVRNAICELCGRKI